MYPLAELDPHTYTLTPLLIEDLVKSDPITQGPDSGGAVYHLKIRDEANWDDGTPITGHDYAFTVKMALNPNVDVGDWRGFLTIITEVLVDTDNPKKFDVIISEPYFLSDILVCNFNIYPVHIYDSTGQLKDIAVRMLTDPARADSLAKVDPRLQQFAQSFMHVRFGNEIVSGSGPYRLVSWETGQRIVLERKANWWGDNLNTKPSLMHAFPRQIIYEIIPDENTALTMVKDGSIDVIAEVSPRAFVDLRADSTLHDRLHFLTPKITQYYSLDLNNSIPILREKNVRKALAHVVDYAGIMENVAQGMAQRTIGPFQPDVAYYNTDIAEVPFDIDKARTLLTEAGWSDTNGNGVLDKMIEGKRTELNIDITVSQRPEGQAIALLLKENAAKVGMEIDIITKDAAMINQDRRNRTFEILPLRPRSNVTFVDPFQNWHSSSDVPGGGNHSGFRNATADSLIIVIRTTNVESERIAAYKELQVVLAEEQPVIFLYVPLERLIINKRFHVQPSARRPGFFENLFTLADL
jgi:peptide/nickel transport system substrate-binding protein